MINYSPLPSHPDLGHKNQKAYDERRAERLRSGRVPNGPAGVMVELLGELVRFVCSRVIRLWQKRR